MAHSNVTCWWMTSFLHVRPRFHSKMTIPCKGRIEIRSRPVMSQHFSWFRIFLTNLPLPKNCYWRKRRSHQGNKEVTCIISKPVVSYLWRCRESVNPPKSNIQKVQGALSSRPKGDPGLLPIFQDVFLLSNHTLDSKPLFVCDFIHCYDLSDIHVTDTNMIWLHRRNVWSTVYSLLSECLEKQHPWAQKGKIESIVYHPTQRFYQSINNIWL